MGFESQMVTSTDHEPATVQISRFPNTPRCRAFTAWSLQIFKTARNRDTSNGMNSDATSDLTIRTRMRAEVFMPASFGRSPIAVEEFTLSRLICHRG